MDQATVAYWRAHAPAWPRVPAAAKLEDGRLDTTSEAGKAHIEAYGVRFKLQQSTLTKDDLAWAQATGAPVGVAEGVRIGTNQMPLGLRMVARDEWHKATGPEASERTLKHLAAALEVVSSGRRLDALGMLDISAGNDAIKAAAGLMVEHGERHEHDASEWLASLGIRTSMGAERLARRIIDEAWWRKTIRHSIRTRRENAYRHAAPKQIEWVSPEGHAERRQIIQAGEAWAKATHLASSDGAIIAAPGPAKIAGQRFAELMARANGLAELAGGCNAYLITLNTPSRFHPTAERGRRGRVRNPKFDGSTPRQGAEWLDARFGLAKKAIERTRAIFHYIGNMQPSFDGSAHVHITAWTDNIGQVEAILRRYVVCFEHEPGAERRLDIKGLGNAAGGVNYASRALRYTARAWGDDQAKQREADAIIQWGSTHNIRLLRTSATAATAWRFSRKSSMPETELTQAARDGDFAQWLGLWRHGGGKLLRTDATNRFDEPVKKTIGIIHESVAYVPTASWRIERGLAPKMSDTEKVSDNEQPGIEAKNRLTNGHLQRERGKLSQRTEEAPLLKTEDHTPAPARAEGSPETVIAMPPRERKASSEHWLAAAFRLSNRAALAANDSGGGSRPLAAPDGAAGRPGTATGGIPMRCAAEHGTQPILRSPGAMPLETSRAA